MRLSIVIPVYNEAAHVATSLSRLFASPCQVEREWIVVDDGSKDGTREILEGLQPQYGFVLIAQPVNGGKSTAVRAGIARATGDAVLIQDADFEYDPRDIPSLLQPILDGEADAVYGSRFKRTSPQVHRTYHFFVNRLLTGLSNLLSGIYLTDMETCYKLVRTDLLKAMVLRSRRFEIEVEITAYLAKTRARIYELPIRYYPRTKLQGKKIRWWDGVEALYYLVVFNVGTSREKAFRELPPQYLPSPSVDGRLALTPT